MSNSSRMRAALAVAIAAASFVYAQSEVAPTNDAPNPYRTITGWAKLPNGRKMGSASAAEGVAVDANGRHYFLPFVVDSASC
ncbi:MAG: hypothetical protein ABSB35_22370 [Bryobacteraceae bacterium]|jgi:hypothetical protein